MEIIQPFNTYLSKKDIDRFTKSQTKLLEHVTNKDNYRSNQYKVFNNLTINKNYNSQNQRRSYFFDCTFSHASFQNCGLTGSYFINCHFVDCNLNFAIFDNCYFDNCTFEYNNDLLLDGHGEKSVIMLQRYMNLTEEEMLCIRWHMGAFDEKENWRRYTKAVEAYPTVLYTHTADMVASQILGV